MKARVIPTQEAARHLPLTPLSLPRYPYPMAATSIPSSSPARGPARYTERIPYLKPLIVRSAPSHERRSIKQTRPVASPAGYGIRTRAKKHHPHDQTPYLARPAPSIFRYANPFDRPYAPRDGKRTSGVLPPRSSAQAGRASTGSSRTRLVGDAPHSREHAERRLQARPAAVRLLIHRFPEQAHERRQL